MQSPQAKLKEIARLLSNWSMPAGDADAALRNYLLAVDDYPADDLAAAVDFIIKGNLPGFDGRFAPTPPMVAGACRRMMNERLDRENLERRLRPALPPPEIEHSPESRAKVKEMVEQVVANLKSVSADEDEAAERRRAAMWGKTNAVFQPDTDARSTRERLGLTITTGDREGDWDCG